MIDPQKAEKLAEEVHEMEVEEEAPYSIEVTQITARDAEDVSKLIYRSYGSSYPRDDLYYPKRIEQALARRNKLGVIARTSEGSAAGHFSIMFNTDSSIGEVCEAVVSEQFRKQGVFKKMMAELIEVAKENEMPAVYADAIALHEYSQRVNNEFGFRSTAILLADFPAVSLRGMSGDLNEPVSEVFEFLPLTDLPVRKICLPDRYDEILRECYENIDTEYELLKPGEQQTPAESLLHVEINYNEKSALITCRVVGEDFVDQVERQLEDMKEKDLNAIFIDLPLEQQATCDIVDPLRDIGFVFSGLMPLFHEERDYLRMQLLQCDLDISKVRTYSETAQRIKQIIAEELAE